MKQDTIPIVYIDSSPSCITFENTPITAINATNEIMKKSRQLYKYEKQAIEEKEKSLQKLYSALLLGRGISHPLKNNSITGMNVKSTKERKSLSKWNFTPS
ncbi:MAG: hypothetical protein AAGH74_07180 [Pseudomonadota bacterium]